MTLQSLSQSYLHSIKAVSELCQELGSSKQKLKVGTVVVQTITASFLGHVRLCVLCQLASQFFLLEKLNRLA